MTLIELITKGKAVFDIADSYAQKSRQYGIDNPVEAAVTFGYQHLEKREIHPQVLLFARRVFGGMYENFERNISEKSERRMEVVHGTIKVAKN